MGAAPGPRALAFRVLVILGFQVAQPAAVEVLGVVGVGVEVVAVAALGAGFIRFRFAAWYMAVLAFGIFFSCFGYKDSLAAAVWARFKFIDGGCDGRYKTCYCEVPLSFLVRVPRMEQPAGLGMPFRCTPPEIQREEAADCCLAAIIDVGEFSRPGLFYCLE